jgi:hypothetical protein
MERQMPVELPNIAEVIRNAILHNAGLSSGSSCVFYFKQLLVFRASVVVVCFH